MTQKPRQPWTDTEPRHLIDDARVLVERYRRRNDPARRLTADERKAWAAEVVTMVEKLSHELAARIGPPDWREDGERRRLWLGQYVQGFRTPKPLPSDPSELKIEGRPLWQRAFKPD